MLPQQNTNIYTLLFCFNGNKILCFTFEFKHNWMCSNKKLIISVAGTASIATCYGWTRKHSLRMRSSPSFRCIEYQTQGFQCTNSEIGEFEQNRVARKHSCIQQCMPSRFVGKSFVAHEITESSYVVIYMCV